MYICVINLAIFQGVQVCIRKKLDRIEIWLGSSKMRSVAEVGRLLKQQLGVAAVKMDFSIHTVLPLS